MSSIDESGYPVPDDPCLAEMALSLSNGGHMASIVDRQWRTVFVTDGLRLASGFMVEIAPVRYGLFEFGSKYITSQLSLRAGSNAVNNARRLLEGFGAWVIEDLGSIEELRRLVDPQLNDIVDRLTPGAATPGSTTGPTSGPSSASSIVYDGFGLPGRNPKMDLIAIRVRDRSGRLAGTALIHKPHIEMSVLAALTAMGDPEHYKRMQSVAAAGRRPAAILFADLEGSSPLAKSLSTANYFALGRRMTRAADQCVVDASGITGRHSGDGVVAFFLAENLGSESAAARSCVEAARGIKQAVIDVATRSDLSPEHLTMRFGLHWGATLYVGQITTAGRTETTALGDDVNEASRIEACATGGRMLASKPLLERLAPEAVRALGLDLNRIVYTQLADLKSATEKARRDAPSIAVCEI